MAEIIKKIRSIDTETGEIYFEKEWHSWNGWSDKGYKYRYRYSAVKFYPDNLPLLEPNVLKIFFDICSIMNEENLLLEKKRPKDKYSGPKITPYTVSDIWEKLPHRFSEYSFKKAWQKITPKYIKKIKVFGKSIWAVNPAFANRTMYLPLFLWKEFKDDLSQKLSTSIVKRYENMELTEGLDKDN